MTESTPTKSPLKRLLKGKSKAPYNKLETFDFNSQDDSYLEEKTVDMNSSVDLSKF